MIKKTPSLLERFFCVLLSGVGYNRCYHALFTQIDYIL